MVKYNQQGIVGPKQLKINKWFIQM